jgi:hypothetical protein
MERGWLVLHESGTYVKFCPGRRGAVRVKEMNATSEGAQVSASNG